MDEERRERATLGEGGNPRSGLQQLGIGGGSSGDRGEGERERAKERNKKQREEEEGLKGSTQEGEGVNWVTKRSLKPRAQENLLQVYKT